MYVYAFAQLRVVGMCGYVPELNGVLDRLLEAAPALLAVGDPVPQYTLKLLNAALDCEPRLVVRMAARSVHAALLALDFRAANVHQCA